MRSQEKQRPCVACGATTRFERDVFGPRGGLIRADACCTACGEENRPAKEAT